MGKVEQLLRAYREETQARQESERRLVEEGRSIEEKLADENLQDFAYFLSHFPLIQPFEELIEVEGLKDPRIALHRNVPEEHRVELIFSWAAKRTSILPVQGGIVIGSERGIRNQILIGWSKSSTGSIVRIGGEKTEGRVAIGNYSGWPGYQDRITDALVRAYFNPARQTLLIGAPNLVKMDGLEPFSSGQK